MSLLSNSSKNRHYGLDVVRSSSLIIILIIHCMIFIGAYYNLLSYLYFGILAVELFFALSGFLIGSILLKIIQLQLSYKLLINFWLKRWMRTLPAYFVVIAIIMLFKNEIYFSFLVFLQNYVPEELKVFPVSWTISLEEWFYLTFPILLYVIYNTTNKIISVKNIFLITTLIYILIPLLLRITVLLNHPDSHWDLSLRKSIFIRFDSIGYGLLLAWTHYYFPKILYQKLIKYGALILAILLMFTTWWYFNQSVEIFNGRLNWVNTLIVFPGVNILCALIIIYALSFKNYKYKPLASLLTSISITSYSLYLIHFQIFRYFSKKSTNEVEAWSYMVLAILVTFLLGFLLNITVEKYFINKRNKWIKPLK